MPTRTCAYARLVLLVATWSCASANGADAEAAAAEAEAAPTPPKAQPGSCVTEACQATAAGVVFLDAYNFSTFVDANPSPTFTLFYSPTCSQCQYFKPIWFDLATKMKEDGVNVTIARLNANKRLNAALCTSFGVEHIPVVIMFWKGYLYRFKDDKMSDETLEAFATGNYTRSPPEPYTIGARLSEASALWALRDCITEGEEGMAACAKARPLAAVLLVVGLVLVVLGALLLLDGLERAGKVRAFAAAGLGIAGYALSIESHLSDRDYSAGCDFAPGMSCTAVFRSPYAHPMSNWGLVPKGHILDLSLAVAGLLLYSGYFLASCAWDAFPHRKAVFLAVAASGAAFSCHLLYVLKFVLKDFCIVCAAFHLVNFSMLGLAIFEFFDRAEKRKSD